MHILPTDDRVNHDDGRLASPRGDMRLRSPAAQVPGLAALEGVDGAALVDQLVGRRAAIVPGQPDRLALDDVRAAGARLLERRRGAGEVAERVGAVRGDERVLAEPAGAVEVQRALDPRGVAAARGPEAARHQADLPALGREEPRGLGEGVDALAQLSLIHISEPTRLLSISYAVFCLK